MNALVRYGNPFSSLSNWLDDFFDDELYERSGRELSTTSWPRVDITETKDGYSLKADVPGMDNKDISINIENDTLIISGEKKNEHEKKEKNGYYHLERSYGSFKRAFSLPDTVDKEHVEAKLSKGVLELTLKKTEAAKPKQIQVNVS